MRIAITISRGRISPLFEYARTMLLIDAVHGRERRREIVDMADLEAPDQRTHALRDRKVDVLICGGILSSGLAAIEGHGIRVFPWVAGTVSEVIDIALMAAAELETPVATTDQRTLVAITAKGADLDASLDPRFGRCRYIVFVADDESFEAVENTSVDMRGGAGIETAKAIAGRGARAVITGSCGPNAFGMLNAALIKVYTEVEGTVRQVHARFERGECPLATGPTVAHHWGTGEAPSPTNTGRGRRGKGQGRGGGSGRGLGRGGGGRCS